MYYCTDTYIDPAVSVFPSCVYITCTVYMMLLQYLLSALAFSWLSNHARGSKILQNPDLDLATESGCFCTNLNVGDSAGDEKWRQNTDPRGRRWSAPTRTIQAHCDNTTRERATEIQLQGLPNSSLTSEDSHLIQQRRTYSH